jgi:hypothetical protein
MSKRMIMNSESGYYALRSLVDLARFVAGKVWIVHIAFPGAHSLASLAPHQLSSDGRDPLKRILSIVANPDDHSLAAPSHERHSRSKPKYVEA